MDELPRLIIIRGNSGSGKSTLAAELRLRTGRRCALVGQDMLRRVVLKEKETQGSDNIDLIEQPSFHLCILRRRLLGGNAMSQCQQVECS